jgi:hypothetical protein
MSIPNFITIITGVGMWVTPRRHSTKVLTTFLELSTFKASDKQRVSLRCNVNNGAFKNGKAARLNNEPLLFTGWHKAALEQN